MQLRDDHLPDKLIRFQSVCSNFQRSFYIRYDAREKYQPFSIQAISQTDFEQFHLSTFNTFIRRMNRRRDGAGFDDTQRISLFQRTTTRQRPNHIGMDTGQQDMIFESIRRGFTACFGSFVNFGH